MRSESKAEHILKKGKMRGYPQHFIFFDTETHYTTLDTGDQEHKLYLGWGCYVSLHKKKKSNTYKEQWHYIKSREDFARWVLLKIKPTHPLYVFGSNVWFDIRITKIDKFLFKSKYVCDRLYNKNMITILGFRKGKKSIVFLAIQNIVPYSVEKIGEWLGIPKISINFEKCTKAELSKYCRRDVEIIKRFVLRWLKFCMRTKMGTFCHTSSAQAFAAYRSRFMQHKIYIHHNKDVIELERDAYYGGRTECFYIGKVKAKQIIKVDINSQYPYVMRENLFPVRLEKTLYNPDISGLVGLTNRYSVVADLHIDIKEPYVAHKVDGKTCFPIGRFRAIVCTRVFDKLYANNNIEHINKISLYQQANIFGKFIKFFGKEKELFSAKKDKCGMVIAKYYLVRLYGKFGQRKDTLVDDESVPLDLIEYIPTYNIESGYNGLIITYGGVRRLLEDRGESSKDAFVAIAAHITEDARLLLWKYICNAGCNSVYYCDTDSLFVNRQGLNNLQRQGFIHPDKLGLLKIEDRTKHCIINTCKDYEFGDEHRKKGIRRDAKVIDKHKYQQYHFPGLYSYLRKHPDNYIIQNIIKEISGDYTKGIVTKSGRVLPYNLSS